MRSVPLILLLLSLINLLNHHVEADQIFPAGGTFGSSSREPKYKIEFHPEDSPFHPPVQEFVLGVYDAEATAAFNQNLCDISTLKDPRSKDASQRYHAHQYKNGTLCDLTNHP